MIRKLLPSVIAGALTCVVASSWAGASPSADATFTATASVVSQYMLRGLRLSAGGMQPAVEMTKGDLVLGAWSNIPFDGDKVPNSSDPEIDLYGYYTIPVNAAVSLAPGFTSYHFPNAPTRAGYYRATFEPNLALNYTIVPVGVRLTPKVYYDVVRKGATYEFNAAYAFPLKEIGSELDFFATVGTYKWTAATNHASPAVTTWGDYWQLSVAAPFQVSLKSKITVGFSYSEGRDAFTKSGSARKSPNPLASSRGAASISYTFSF